MVGKILLCHVVEQKIWQRKACFQSCWLLKNGTHGFFDKEEHLNKVIDDTIKYIKEVLHESCINSDGFD